MAHGDAREEKWRGNWRIEWVASTLHTTPEYGVSSINTADTHATAARSRLSWRPHRFKLTRPLRRKTKSGFCACAIKRASGSSVSYTNSKSFYTIFRFKFVRGEFAPLVNTSKHRYLTAEHRNEWSYTSTPPMISCLEHAEFYYIWRKFVQNEIFFVIHSG
jgi:hypothetical protein